MSVFFYSRDVRLSIHKEFTKEQITVSIVSVTRYEKSANHCSISWKDAYQGLRCIKQEYQAQTNLKHTIPRVNPEHTKKYRTVPIDDITTIVQPYHDRNAIVPSPFHNFTMTVPHDHIALQPYRDRTVTRPYHANTKNVLAIC